MGRYSGKKYCKVQGKYVYSCDHAKCNGQDPKEHQGMKYCKVQKKYVYGCNHYECG